MTRREKRRKKIRWMKRHGYARPRLTLRAVRASHINFAEAMVLLMKESGGGRNVFGCDFGSSGDRPPYCGHAVTPTRLAALLSSRFQNGVGPTQLTFRGFIDRVNEPSDPRVLRGVGRLWAARPFLNMVKGFSIFETYRDHKTVFGAALAYNGGEEYARDFTHRLESVQRSLRKAGL